ncbi:expressed unknown protein [Seminavis robusta]|uniref:Uncharacterized protein n=1 Tax=Seminavis robusta TaxID=568900 RepID=A0A9N8E3F5_9STRA|nr:expressed unknown protein [Seminavis robusta]|eukprot:Sro505_g156200.1 n/a (250) ;mRNA; r:46364-47113
MRRGMDPPEDPPAARSYGGSITGPEGEIYLSPETVEEQEYRNARAPIDVVTTRGLEVEPSMISLDADLCRMSMTHLGAGTNSTQDPDVVVPPVRGLTSAISLVLHEPPAMDGSSPSGSYVDAPVVYQEPSCGGNASVASMRSSLSAIDAPTDAPDTTENNPTPVSVQNSIPNTSQRPSRGPGVNMRDPSMISICEDLPFQYDMQLPTTSLQEEQATQPTTALPLVLALAATSQDPNLCPTMKFLWTAGE